MSQLQACRPGPASRALTTSRRAVLVVAFLGAAPASAQDRFDLGFDHSTVLVTDLDASAAFYASILHLEPLETPWGPTAPIRFFALGGGRQLHMGVTDRSIEPDRNSHLAFTVPRFDAYLEFLSERGIAYGNFAGTSGDPQVRPDGIRQIYFQDPDGNWIEINDTARPGG